MLFYNYKLLSYKPTTFQVLNDYYTTWILTIQCSTLFGLIKWKKDVVKELPDTASTKFWDEKIGVWF